MQKARETTMTWTAGFQITGNRAATTGGRLPVKAKSIQEEKKSVLSWEWVSPALCATSYVAPILEKEPPHSRMHEGLPSSDCI